MRRKLARALLVLLVLASTTSCTTFYYGSPFDSQAWTPPEIVQPGPGGGSVVCWGFQSE